MASQAVRDFYAQRKADDIARIQTMIQSGTKASNNLAIGRRMMNPSYKGMVPNASGVGQRPFFINKDEANVSLEDKVAMRGGVLTTPAGQTYGKKILARRAMDVRNQEALEEGLPPAPSPLVDMTEVESRTVELNQLMDTIDNVVEQRVDASQIIPDFRNLVRLIVSLSATFSGKDLAYIDNWAANIASMVQNSATLALREANDRPEEAAIQNKSLKTLAGITANISKFIERVSEYADSDETTKRAAIRAAAKDIFGTIGRMSESAIEAVEKKAAPLAPAPKKKKTPPLPPAPAPAPANVVEQILATPVRRAPPVVDIATYKTDLNATGYNKEDRIFISKIQEAWDLSKAAREKELRKIARDRGISFAPDETVAVLKGMILRDAGFLPTTVTKKK